MGKGSSQPAPSQQTTNNTSIPSYAQPYVEQMLGQTAALTDINQNPYQNYGGQRIAGFSPMQTQAMTNVGNMQIAPQLAQATGYAGQAGQGYLGTTGAALGYGQQGAGYGQQATGAGQAYQTMATDPSQIQKYMNPYIQDALNPQLQLLNQQQALQGQGIAAKASGQGAFGGNRAALSQGLNAQNYALAGQQAIGQGYSDAFKSAQQAQQFGADLGLRGLQTGIQGAQTGLQGINSAQAGYGGANQAAATLGQLGQTQYGQQMGINQAQMQAGAMQQALQQQGLDVNYQDFLKERNYPYQQLAFQSDMLRGLPLSQTAQTMYAAPPSAASQIGGLGTAGLGIYGMSGGFRAKGGMVGEGYAKGGQISYAGGGDISMMSTEQLTQLLDSPTLTPMESAMIEKQLMLRARMENNPQTPQIMGGGLDTIPSGDTFNAAGGGIVAFAGPDGSLVNERSSTPKPIRPEIKDYQSWLESQIRSSIENQDKVNPFAKSEEMQAQYGEDMKARREQRPYELLTALGIGTAAGNSQYGLSNLGQGGVYALQQQQKLAAEDAADRKLMLTQATEQEKSKYARDTGKIGSMQTALGQMYSKEIGLKNASATAGNTAFYRAQNAYNSAVKDARDTLIDQAKIPGSDAYKTYRKDPAALERDAIANAKREVGPQILDTLGLPKSKSSTDVVISGAPVTGAPAGKGPSAMPMPSSAKDAIVGQVYTTARGPAKWDGKQFIPIQ
jgi:hypothetical protein